MAQTIFLCFLQERSAPLSEAVSPSYMNSVSYMCICFLLWVSHNIFPNEKINLCFAKIVLGIVFASGALFSFFTRHISSIIHFPSDHLGDVRTDGSVLKIKHSANIRNSYIRWCKLLNQTSVHALCILLHDMYHSARTVFREVSSNKYYFCNVALVMFESLNYIPDSCSSHDYWWTCQYIAGKTGGKSMYNCWTC